MIAYRSELSEIIRVVELCEVTSIVKLVLVSSSAEILLPSNASSNIKLAKSSGQESKKESEPKSFGHS